MIGFLVISVIMLGCMYWAWLQGYKEGQKDLVRATETVAQQIRDRFGDGQR